LAVKLILFSLSLAFDLTITLAQQPPTAATGGINLTAKSANVSESGTPVRINLFRWSTDEERNSLVASMDPKGPPTGARGRGGRGGRGGLDPNDPALADVGGVGAASAGRGGRGGGRGGRGDAPAAPPNPIASLTTAIGNTPTIGYIWTNEVVGYSVKYAYRAPLPDGGERIILATNRRLGADTPSWKLQAASTASIPTEYDFTVFEIRLDSKGVGEGKTSLTTKVVVDNDAKSIALENYAATPAVLQSVKR
jgi:hypothetical protein